MKVVSALTITEKATVEENMDLVEKVIKRHIHISKDVNGLDFDDLFQIGCIGLCAAAKTYNGSVKFQTYASKVIKNKLIDHCRMVVRSENHQVLMNDMEDLYFTDVDMLESVEDLTQSYIHTALSFVKEKYTGVVRKGIISMELRLEGYSLKEIAAIYGVSQCLVGAWISKATKRLRNDKTFVKTYLSDYKAE